MIFLQEDRIVLIIIKVEDCFQVLLIKVSMLKLTKHNVSLLGFTESSQEDVEVMLNLFRSFGVDLGSNAIHVINWSPSESFDELDIVSL